MKKLNVFRRWSVDQVIMIKYRIDLIDFSLFEFLSFCATLDETEFTVLDNKRYYHFDWKEIVRMMPCLGLSNRQSVSKRINRLVERDLLVKHPRNKSLKKCFCGWGNQRGNFVRELIDRDTVKGYFLDTVNEDLQSNNEEKQSVQAESKRPFTVEMIQKTSVNEDLQSNRVDFQSFVSSVNEGLQSKNEIYIIYNNSIDNIREKLNNGKTKGFTKEENDLKLFKEESEVIFAVQKFSGKYSTDLRKLCYHSFNEVHAFFHHIVKEQPFRKFSWGRGAHFNQLGNLIKELIIHLESDSVTVNTNEEFAHYFTMFLIDFCHLPEFHTDNFTPTWMKSKFNEIVSQIQKIRINGKSNSFIKRTNNRRSTFSKRNKYEEILNKTGS